MLSASCFIICRDMVVILGECFWRLFKRVCIITHTTWIFKPSTVCIYTCFLLYSLIYLAENIFHAELPITLHCLNTYFLHCSWQPKKGNSKFQKMPSSSVRPSFLLSISTLYSHFSWQDIQLGLERDLWAELSQEEEPQPAARGGQAGRARGELGWDNEEQNPGR